MFSEEYGPLHRDAQIVTRSGRVAQPPPVDRPFAGTYARDEIKKEDMLIDLLLARMLEMRLRRKMMRFYTSCAPLMPAFPFEAYWPHPTHIEMR